MHPQFPDFKPIELADRDMLREIVWEYQPVTSELTFTNLFIWRTHYKTLWSLFKDWLIVLCADSGGRPYALQPIGPASRREATKMLFGWLREEKGLSAPCIERADKRFISELGNEKDFIIEPEREHFDYVYLRDDLAKLAGRKYHGKKNHVNKIMQTHACTYAEINETYIQDCLAMQDTWCTCHKCAEDMNLMGEWGAIGDLLKHFQNLKVQGSVILINGKVEAFTIGELLNEQTAVVHIEKANTGINGLYTLINQQCCEKAWQNVSYVNREQDLGNEGLRQAKLSYHPDYLSEKFKVRPAR